MTNTTNQNRGILTDRNKNEKGGLSGVPIRALSLKFIKKFFKDNKGKIPIIGVGGIDDGHSAFEMITAGASVIQLYTGMVFKGPGIVKNIKSGLVEILAKEKIHHIKHAIGINS